MGNIVCPTFVTTKNINKVTQKQVYDILLKHSDKFTGHEWSEISQAIADYGISEWYEGREKIKALYNIK